jgi:hypothetical protein
VRSADAHVFVVGRPVRACVRQMIPMFDQQKRHLMKKELKALYKNLAPLKSE